MLGWLFGGNGNTVDVQVKVTRQGYWYCHGNDGGFMSVTDDDIADEIERQDPAGIRNVDRYGSGTVRIDRRFWEENKSSMPSN